MTGARSDGKSTRRESIDSNPWDSSPSRAAKHSTAVPSTPGDAMLRCLALGREQGCFPSEAAPPEARRQGADDNLDNDVVSLVMSVTRSARALSNKQIRAAGRPSSNAHKALLDTGIVQAKADKLAHATVTLRQLVKNKDVVLNRLQQPAPGSSLPVETSGQPDLVLLLNAAATDAELLGDAGADLEWAASFDKPCSTWPELLRHLPEGVAACRTQRARLSEAREKMAQLTAAAP